MVRWLAVEVIEQGTKASEERRGARCTCRSTMSLSCRLQAGPGWLHRRARPVGKIEAERILLILQCLVLARTVALRISAVQQESAASYRSTPPSCALDALANANEDQLLPLPPSLFRTRTMLLRDVSHALRCVGGAGLRHKLSGSTVQRVKTIAKTCEVV